MAKNHYVNNADFLKSMIQYKKDCRRAKRAAEPKPKIPDYMGKCLMLIAENLSHKPNFISYSFRDEMICDAIENCIMYFDNFDPKKSKNPFAYFTQIIYFAFIRRIHKEKKQRGRPKGSIKQKQHQIVNVKVVVVLPVGVPEITPVPVFRVIPVGKLPLVTA
jgi:hypothetical protein